MPIYEYYCEENNTAVEVIHSIKEKIKTWGQLCELTGIDQGDVAPETPITRLLYAAQVSTPTGNSHLKNIGFTKLVKRDDGVYENVTRTGDEKRYMTRGDAASLPNLKNKITD